MNDEIKALLEELNLSEETATQITAVLAEAFEKAKEEGKKEAEVESAEKDKEIEELKEHIEFIMEQAENYGAYLMEKANEYGDFLKEKANAYGEHVKDTLTEKVKEYADFAVEQFIAENKERFVETEEYERMKSSFIAIKEAFEYNGFDVREDVHVQELQQSLIESTEEYEKIFEELQNARNEISSLQRQMILEKATADLAETQKEKLNELLENVSFDTTEEFSEGINLLVEQVKSQTVVVADEGEILSEDVKPSGKTIDPSVARYLKLL